MSETAITVLAESTNDEVDDAETRSESAVAAVEAEAFERRVRQEAQVQFKKLKYDAQAIFGIVCGRPGVRSAEEWAELLEKAGDDIGNGNFIVRELGAKRYLDYETVAVLVTLRQNLLAEISNARTSDIMMVDAAVLAYYNMIRVQAWIGNLSLTVERELFGEAPLNAYHGEQTAQRIEQQIRRLADVLLPLQDRAHRMLARSLATLRR
jgi:hypothetical protein